MNHLTVHELYSVVTNYIFIQQVLTQCKQQIYLQLFLKKLSAVCIYMKICNLDNLKFGFTFLIIHNLLASQVCISCFLIYWAVNSI